MSRIAGHQLLRRMVSHGLEGLRPEKKLNRNDGFAFRRSNAMYVMNEVKNPVRTVSLQFILPYNDKSTHAVVSDQNRRSTRTRNLRLAIHLGQYFILCRRLEGGASQGGHYRRLYILPKGLR